MIILFIIIFGLLIGSFLNVLILRLPLREPIIKSRSRCPNCKHLLGFLDLFPIFSFLFLKGKCRYCKKSISLQYPLVEGVTALLFLIAYFIFISNNGINFSSILQLLRVWFFVSVMIIIFVYDLKKYLILDRVIYPSIIIAILTIPIFLGGRLNQNIFWGIFLAAILGGGFFLFQYLVSGGKWVGGGDVKMGVLMGLILGFTGLLIALFFAYILGAVISIFLIAVKKKTIKDALPFGPFLASGTIISLFWGEFIIKLFFRF
jgi:prepilin signal peptidase PulO-like enzyme (type II secretory pathway)